ncbi:MAG: hypothetical protein L6Q51_02390 [Cyclobacteriaceae bacterium]|nr:hypothetical protein [Cyclobacteriaceae bacterium]
MKKRVNPALKVIVCALFSLKIYAQTPVRQITLDLNPIAIENGRYYFNGKRVTFDGLLIPLQAVDDNQVNQSIKTALTLRTSQTVVRLGLSVYLLYLIADQPPYVNYHQTRTLVLSSVAAGFSLNIAEKLFQRKAVKRFNAVLLGSQK